MYGTLPLISIVIPVYKVESYLKRCIDSILYQTYNNLDIILVDDGSPDNCPTICDEYGKKDKRVHVIHKENSGPSESRNVGTMNARGSYISYIDSDDFVSPDYVEYLYGLIVKYKTQLSICRLLDCMDTIMSGDGQEQEMVLNSEQALIEMFYQKEFTTSASGKLYQTSLMRQFLFPVNRRHEDLMTIYKILVSGSPVAYGQKQLYYYMHHDGSFSASTFNNQSVDIKIAADEFYEFVLLNYPGALSAAKCRKFSCYCQLFSILPEDNTQLNLSNELWEWIVQNRDAVLKNIEARKKNRIAVLCTFFGRKLFKKIYSIK